MELLYTVDDSTEVCRECQSYVDNQMVVLRIDPETAGSKYDWVCPKCDASHKNIANDAEVTLQMMGADY